MNQEKGDGTAIIGCLGCGVSALAFPGVPLGLLLGLPLLGGTSWGKGFVAASLAAFILPMAVDRIGSTLVLLTVAYESGSGWVRRVLRIGLIAVSLALWPVWGLVVLSVLLSGGSLLRLFGTLILIGIVVAVVDFALIAISGALASPTPVAQPSPGTLGRSGPTDLAAGTEHGATADAEEDDGDADDALDEDDEDFGDDTDFEDEEEFEEDEDFLDEDDDLDEADEEAEDENGVAEPTGPVLTDEQRAVLFRIEQEAIARILAQRGVPPGSFVNTENEAGSGGVRPKEGGSASTSGGGKKVEPSIVEKILSDVKRREEEEAAAKARAIIDEERAKRGNGSGQS